MLETEQTPASVPTPGPDPFPEKALPPREGGLQQASEEAERILEDWIRAHPLPALIGGFVAGFVVGIVLRR